jgi:hypothetical protein
MLFDPEGFAAFDTETHSVAVNMKKVLWTNILFDPGAFREERDGEGIGPLTLYFDDGPEPHEIEIDPDHLDASQEDAEDGAQLQWLLMDLDGLGEDNKAVSFVDGDGEEVIVQTARLAAIEIPLAAVNPRLAKAIFTGMDEDETAEEPAAS